MTGIGETGDKIENIGGETFAVLEENQRAGTYLPSTATPPPTRFGRLRPEPPKSGTPPLRVGYRAGETRNRSGF